MARVRAEVWIDPEAASPHEITVSLNARFFFGEIPTSAFGTYRTTYIL